MNAHRERDRAGLDLFLEAGQDQTISMSFSFNILIPLFVSKTPSLLHQVIRHWSHRSQCVQRVIEQRELSRIPRDESRWDSVIYKRQDQVTMPIFPLACHLIIDYCSSWIELLLSHELTTYQPGLPTPFLWPFSTPHLIRYFFTNNCLQTSDFRT